MSNRMRSVMPFPLPQDLIEVLREAPTLRRAYLVGGCVRDWLLGRPVRDVDLEVYGVSYESLAEDLARWGRTDLVGRAFGVVKLNTGEGIHDFAIPRRDSKVAPGHKGFAMSFDPDITPQEASARRDFTINAIMFDPRENRILDFHGGRDDLESRILRHTSDAFAEDPLRVLRGMQLASRFMLTPFPATLELCRSIRDQYAELAAERVREEWFKWAADSLQPSVGLKFLCQTEWLGHFPEIQALTETPQDPEWHPEGDVFIHTCHSCDALARLPAWQSADRISRIVYMLAVLAHDFGKPSCTQPVVRDGRRRIVSPGHEEAGRLPTQMFLERLMAPHAVLDRVVPLVTNHLAHLQSPHTDRSVRRLARRLHPETIEGLCLVMTADHFGRPPKPALPPPAIGELRERAKALAVEAQAPRPILMGRHLIQLGLTPGPIFKRILDTAFEAQLDGEIADLDNALQWLRQQQAIDLPEEFLRNIKVQLESSGLLSR